MVIRAAAFTVTAAIALLLVSCDRMSGVRTDAEFATIDANCVDSAIQKTPGIGTVSHSMTRTENFQILPYRGKVVTLSHQWRYGADGTESLQLFYDGRGWKYFNGLIRMGPRWSSEKLAAYKPLMERVNAEVERRCGVPIAEVGHVVSD